MSYLKCVTGIIHVCYCLVEMCFIVFDLLIKVRFKSMSLKHAIVNFDDLLVKQKTHTYCGINLDFR